MFADAFLDSQRLGHSRRGWATLTSFGVQAVAVAFLFVVPLFYTQVLPRFKVSTPVALPPLGDAPIQHVMTANSAGDTPSIFTVARPDVLRPPSEVPHGIHLDDDVRPPEVPFGRGGNGNRGGGSRDGILNGIGDPTAVVIMPRHPTVTPPPPHISVMMEGHLIHRVDPTYPPIARAAGIQGSVVIAAVIGTDGSVQKLQVLSGSPLLAPAARAAVAQWQYRPYLLNGVPIEVDTQITVNFILAR